MSSRTPFSINLDEDYEIYGIDPNENLDDWSFLEAKPEPLPERDEEEKRLFEQLLAPSIPEEEIQTEIHDRLKSLLEETSKFIENDVKVELSAPIEISEEQVNQFTDKNSFENKQADRMSTIVKDILHTTQEAEDIDDLIQTLTKSDKIAEKINEEDKELSKTLEKEESKKKKEKSFSKTSPATLLTNTNQEKENNGNDNDNIQEPQNIPEPEQPQVQQKFLDRYKRKPNATSTIIRDHDQTERLSSKFLLDKRKREEENQAELEKKIKEREERQKSFFESLDKEVEKHKREVQMIKEIKESKAPSLSEMINQIRPPTQEEPAKEVNPNLLKSKTKKAEKPPPRYTKDKIDEFLALRTNKLKLKSSQPVLMIELTTNKPNNNNNANITKNTKNSKSKKNDDKENMPHLSSTYQKKVGEKLAALLQPLLKEKKKTDVNKLWRIAIFMRMAYHLKNSKLSKKVTQFHLKLLLKRWRKRRRIIVRKKNLAAISIQRAFRRYKAKIQEKQKQKNVKERKEITDQQILDKTRQMISQKVPDVENLPSQKYQQKKPKQKPNFNFPILNDPDTSWIDTFEKDKIEGDESSGLFFDNDMLDELPNKPILRLDEVLPEQKKDNVRKKHHKKHQQQFQAESQSVPFEPDVYDYLGKFGQKIDLQDQDIEIDIDIYEQAGSGSKRTPKKNSKSNANNESQNRENNENNESIEPSSPQQQPPPSSPQQLPNETSLVDGYNFKNQDTARMMQKMINKKTKQSNHYKNEKPVEKFNRLYGANGAAANHHAPNIKHMPQAKYNDFRASNTRAQRLKNLKKVWLGNHNEQQDQQQQQPPPQQQDNNQE